MKVLGLTARQWFGSVFFIASGNALALGSGDFSLLAFGMFMVLGGLGNWLLFGTHKD